LSDHLSTQLLEGYGRRRLEAAELLAMDSHISTCASCREKLREMKPRSAALLALRASLRVASEAASTHPSRDELMAYIGSRLDEIDREMVESHLEVCPLCAAQTEALNNQAADDARMTEIRPASAARVDSRARLWARFMGALAASSLRARIRRLSLTPRAAVAVAVAASLVMAFVWWPRARNDGREIGNRPSPPQSSASPPSGPS
jgi:anti-sigma factor RsiW